MQRPSPALLVSLVALFVALGGTSYAAITSLPKNSVGTAQLKNGAVTAPKINVSAMLHRVVYALVNADGTVDATQSSGITSSMVHLYSPPTRYCFSGLPFTPNGGSVTIAGTTALNPGGDAYLQTSDSGVALDCPAEASVEVATHFGGQTNPEAFYIVLYG
jgi:hypothetical protein